MRNSAWTCTLECTWRQTAGYSIPHPARLHATWIPPVPEPGQWWQIDSVNVYRDYGSSVMYDNGKVLVMGGGDPPTNTAEVIDLNASTPAWRSVAPMAFARRQLNATLLPDGKVLVTGGTSGPGFNNTNTPVFAAEMWDPATENWATMASQQFPRLIIRVRFCCRTDGFLQLAGKRSRRRRSTSHRTCLRELDPQSTLLLQL